MYRIKGLPHKLNFDGLISRQYDATDLRSKPTVYGMIGLLLGCREWYPANS